MSIKTANRLNKEIRAPQVRLISLDGEQLGIVEIERAMQIAEEAGVDLVEVAPNASPPVCRVMDYKKLQYEQHRRQKEARKHQRQIEVKALRLRPSIDPHDYHTKLSQLRGFLAKGFRVKIMIVFKGVQLRRYDMGTTLLDRLIADVKDIGALEPGSRSQRRMITALISPNKDAEHAQARQHAEQHAEKKPPRTEQPVATEQPVEVKEAANSAEESPATLGAEQQPESAPSPQA